MGLISKVKFHRVFSVAAGALFLAQATVASAGPFTGRLYHSEAAEMEQTFAIGLQSTAKAKQVDRDIVVLIDTSASQMGDHRQLSMSVVESLLASLGTQDRVHLVVPSQSCLMAGFVSPDP